MIILVHVLQHLGLPSGVAIAVAIVCRKFLKGAIAGTLARRERHHGSSRHYR